MEVARSMRTSRRDPRLAAVLAYEVARKHPPMGFLDRHSSLASLRNRFQDSAPEKWWALRGSNPRPSDYESPALTD